MEVRSPCRRRRPASESEEEGSEEEVVSNRRAKVETDEEATRITSLLQGGGSARSASDRLRALRVAVVDQGLKVRSKQRPVIWKLFLGVGKVDAAAYAALVARGAAGSDRNVRGDAKRTFRSDRAVRDRVKDDEITRVLHALRHSRHADDRHTANRCPVCAALLYVMDSELEAFWTLRALASRHCPTYFAADLHGVFAGAALVAACLAAVDAKLAAKLQPTAHFEACVVPCLTSFFACLRPLDGVVQLWDVVFAVGPHFLVVIYLGLCAKLRNKLLDAADPFALLQARNLPTLDAPDLLRHALALAPDIPPHLYDLLKRHPTTRLDRADIHHAANLPIDETGPAAPLCC